MKTQAIKTFRFQKFFLFFSFLWINLFVSAESNKIDLSGQWDFKIDSLDVGINERWFLFPMNDKIQLPGTTDDAKFGIANQLTPELKKPQVLRLTRKNRYVGAAWYSRSLEIPKSWKNKQITLSLERVIWETRVWVNNQEIPEKQESLSTPHQFDLTPYIQKGNNKITIRVDNRKKHNISVNEMAHAYTDETQIKWNGIIGEIACIAKDKIQIEQVQIYPDIDKNTARIKITIRNYQQKIAKGNITLWVSHKQSGNVLSKLKIPFSTKKNTETVEVEYNLGEIKNLWDEFQPNLYQLTTEIKSSNFNDQMLSTFGMRKINNQKAKLQINNQPLFLRGTLECSIFPLTGHPPMEKQEWLKLMQTAREWGLNHLRFHSWCPPEAAFAAADELGFYLQVELPLWSLEVNKDAATNQFLYAEADKIIKAYGNHPSFCFWSIGNELQPDFLFLNQFVDYLKKNDSRHLYTNTSFTFEKGHGLWPERNDDFFVTQYTKKGWVRGQGVFDKESPTFNKDYSASTDSLPVPLITHEIGQYAVYPDLKEIQKYTGVLDPLNFKAVKEDLTRKKLLHKADDYLMASGKLAALLYKEEIERALKTEAISGFQLLDLHDFPGQGTALVGLLNAFWETKGLIKSEEFRTFCAPVVPLLNFEKAVYKNSERFKATVEVINFGKDDLKNKSVNWTLLDNNKIIQTGQSKIETITRGVKTKTGEINIGLDDIRNAKKLIIQLRIEGTEYKNDWSIWVYPENLTPDPNNIIITSDKQEAVNALNKGKNVLYNPEISKIKGLEGKFVPVFWSPVHFPDQPGTMGLLLNPQHQVFRHFPTEMHTNWQWWDLCKKSKTIQTDSLPGVKSLIEQVDNFMNNRRLSSMFEVKAGNGKLIFSTMDITRDLENRPEARQLLYSVLEYMKSEWFNPEGNIDPVDLNKIVTD